MAIGVPRWPEFACWTASIESVRIVLTHSWSSWAFVIRPASTDRSISDDFFSLECSTSTLWLLRVLPAADVSRQPVGFDRPPRSGVVFMHGGHVVEYGLH